MDDTASAPKQGGPMYIATSCAATWREWVYIYIVCSGQFSADVIMKTSNLVINSKSNSHTVRKIIYDQFVWKLFDF